MGAFARTILMGRSGSSRLNSIASLFKQFNDITTLAQVSTLIKTHVFVRDISRETMEGQPTIEEVNGRPFIAKSFTVESAAVMVDDKTVACLTIETLKTTDSITIIRFLDDETEVNGDALVAHGRMARVSGTTVSMT
jgi:hypothetical protein